MTQPLELANRELARLIWMSAAALAWLAAYLLLLALKKRHHFRGQARRLGYATPEIGHPFLGHLREHTAIERQADWFKRFGKLYGFYNCDRLHLRVADLEMINEIFLKQSRNFVGRTWHEYRLSLFNSGILFNMGARWRQARRLFHPALALYRMSADEGESSPLNAKLLRGVRALLSHFKRLSRPDASCEGQQVSPARPLPDYANLERTGFVVLRDSASPTGYSIDMRAHGMMEVLALDIILRVGLDVDEINVLEGTRDPMMKFIDSWLHAVDDPLAQWATAVPALRFLMPFYVLFINRSYGTYIKFMRTLFKRHNERLAAHERAQRLAGSCGGNGDDSLASEPASIFQLLVAEFRAGRMRRSHVIAHAGATIVAGFETTATTASYILWCIARHAELKGRLLEEIERDGIRSRYLDMFIKEVMRMYPALANFVIRSPKEDVLVAGRLIKRGMSVHLGVNSVHFDATIHPQPHRFDPERFAEGKTYPPGAYVPFGLGHRMCVGYHLAMREMKIFVVEIFRDFDIQLIAPQLELERESLTIFLTRSKNEIRVKLVPRREFPEVPAGGPPAGSATPPAFNDHESTRTTTTANVAPQ